jgi:D-tyrosyl-tRNA(Tyr) deacylase
MKLVIQRVLKASVTVEKEVISSIDKGFLVLTGITGADTKKEADFLAEKLVKLRIMDDGAARLADSPRASVDARRGEAGDGESRRGKMNLSIVDAGGSILIVSQFTLYGDTKGGNRPSFINAARPEVAEPLYDYFVGKVKSLGVAVATGRFGADMKIDAVLDGPVTILIEN